jgi:hypothetical protein
MRTFVSSVLSALLFLASPVRAQAAHKATITWPASSDAAANPTLGYFVYRLTAACPSSGTAGFTKITSTPVMALTYVDTTIGLGPVCYYVTATLNGAESVPSNTAGGTATLAGVNITVTVGP